VLSRGVLRAFVGRPRNVGRHTCAHLAAEPAPAGGVETEQGENEDEARRGRPSLQHEVDIYWFRSHESNDEVLSSRERRTLDLLSKTDGELPSRGYSYYVLTVLTVMYTFNYLDRYVLTILVVPIKQDLGLSDTMMGFLLGPAFALFYTALGIPIARLADRRSRRVILSLSFVVWSAMTAAAGLARSATMLAATRIGVGIGEAGGTAPAHSLISDYFPPERRALAFGVFQQGVYLGQLLGLAVGGVLVGTIGWRQTFYVVGLPGVVLAAVLYATVREPRRGAFDKPAPMPSQGSAEPSPTSSDGAETPSLLATFRHLWQRPSFRALIVGTAIASFAGTGFGFWVPVLLERVHGMTRMDIGFQFGPVAAISGSLGALLAGILTDRLSRRDPRWLMWIPAASVMSSLPFLIGICLWPNATGAILCAIPAGILGGGWAPAAYAAAQSIAPAQMRALAASITILGITLFGMGAGPQAIGILNDLLAPSFGADAVRYSMVGVLCTSIVGALALAWGATRISGDL
jgi:MFS family permease